MKMFIGRKEESKKLQEFLKRPGLQTALIYGRRRVGKSELILHVLKDEENVIYYECKQTQDSSNASSLKKLAVQILSLPPLELKSFEDVLEYLFEYATEKPLTLVLDEYSYLHQTVIGIDSVLQALIDQHKKSSNLHLILCGSYIDVMQGVLEYANPLYGRIDLTMKIDPMDYLDSSLFYPAFSNEDKVRMFTVLGGIPYYNQFVDDTKSVRENIIRLIASKNAVFENEVSVLLKGEIGKLVYANEILETIAAGIKKSTLIKDRMNLPNSANLTYPLKKLNEMELIHLVEPINQKGNRKKSYYEINDPFTQFYFKYIVPNASSLRFMNSDRFYERFIEQDFETILVPKQFESICSQYLIRQNIKDQLEEPFFDIGKYYYDDPVNRSNGEFDIVTEDANGFIFYEAKFKNRALTSDDIKREMLQVQKTSLSCYRFGFFSRGGYDHSPENNQIFYTLDDLYKNDS